MVNIENEDPVDDIHVLFFLPVTEAVAASGEPVSVDDFVPDGGRLDQSFLNDVVSSSVKESSPVMVEEDRYLTHHITCYFFSILYKHFIQLYFV